MNFLMSLRGNKYLEQNIFTTHHVEEDVTYCQFDPHKRTEQLNFLCFISVLQEINPQSIFLEPRVSISLKKYCWFEVGRAYASVDQTISSNAVQVIYIKLEVFNT